MINDVTLSNAHVVKVPVEVICDQAVFWKGRREKGDGDNRRRV